MTLRVFTLLILSFFAFASPALAERRVALVIGNGNYASVPKLPNPSDDAAAMADTLKQAGFEVILRTDLDQQNMASALADFSTALNGADVGLFYYAGHAIQYAGQNYLVSTNARLENPFALNSDAIPLEQIVETMQAQAKVNLVLLDACRNNPFVDRLKQSLPAARSVAVSRGLAPINVNASDTMIVYATSSNQTAADGNGPHSPFTQALLHHIMTPGIEVSLVMKRVIQEVRDATLQQQNPEVLNQMASEFYFVPATAPGALTPLQVALPVTPPGTTPTAPDNFDAVTAAFREAMAVGTAPAWRNFVMTYPDTSLSVFAQQALERAVAAEAALPQTGVTVLPQEATTPLTINGTPEVKVADLPPESRNVNGAATLAPSTQTFSVEPDPIALKAAIQFELNRIGCNVGKPDGVWGKKSDNGLQRFAKETGEDVAALGMSLTLLDKLRARQSLICPVECSPTQITEGNSCVAKTCPAGQRLSNSGNCFVPIAATPKKQTASPQAQTQDQAAVPPAKKKRVITLGTPSLSQSSDSYATADQDGGGSQPAADPGTADPGTTDPGTTDPGTTDPGTDTPVGQTSDPTTGGTDYQPQVIDPNG